MNNEISDLYCNLVCALTHNIDACDNCKKCGIDGADCRLNIVEELTKYMNKEFPYDRRDDDE